jgi:F-type H+-transporting ATPase subunit delta
MQIARPYASALFDVASEAKALDAVEKALDEFTGLINENADFQRFLRSPAITHDQKVPVIDAIVAKAGTLDLVAKFLKTVARHGRLFALPQMISQFKALSAKGRGEATAEVTSASPLSKAQLKSLADTLKSEMSKTVKLETRVDPDLIGGLVVKVGSRMIDSSLRTKLSAMKIAMKEVG